MLPGRLVIHSTNIYGTAPLSQKLYLHRNDSEETAKTRMSVASKPMEFPL